MTINLLVKRFDPSLKSDPYTDTFEITVSSEEKWTVLDLLDHVQKNFDSSLRYYRHSVCNRGICMRCLAKVNGRVSRLCEYVIASDSEIMLEPANEKAIVIDLVTKLD